MFITFKSNFSRHFLTFILYYIIMSIFYKYKKVQKMWNKKVDTIYRKIK